MNFTESTKKSFNEVADYLLGQLTADEAATLNLHAEETTFVRFNNNKVRQNTFVEQRTLGLSLQSKGKSANLSFSITGVTAEDKKRADHWLAEARKECDLLPEDPYIVPIQNNGSSDKTVKGYLLNDEDLFVSITRAAQGSDLAGLYCGGALISANRNSKGQSHWFANESFFMDYSLYMGEKAVKGSYAGRSWDQQAFEAKLAQSKNLLGLMDRPKKVLAPGAYRTYLAPGAVAELSTMFYWGSLSFNGYKQGNSSLTKLANKEKHLSPLLSLRENYTMGLTHQYNSLGEVAPETLELITKGELKNYLISSRSAKEYDVKGNNAAEGEYPRALEILPGTLKEQDILKELGTGLYLSNLHYLNWSDRMNARITGMTRYACFWVENGEIVAPIADLRFDESLYDCLGANLLAVTEFQEVDPEVSTYENRSFGGKKIPGMLIKDFKFTL
ncbi:TldD/PmbA family protein [Bdellovibrio sp. NC01]|uniref:TldD/PmbA family protein n=1 Tax=Bdellovibrio sp. NC01 TaxID=2220073 RepID=UPI00115B2B71|nr:metallopeptidase TldD-related protein [Bdellovibrio sp. NC01]QDK36732.1 Zn-dependent protease [Bdellovibrio sp. NC01]